MEIDQIVALLADHKWAAAAVIVIGCAVRLSKSDITWVGNIEPRWRALFALALGVVSGTFDAIATQRPWLPQLLAGLASAMVAIASHDVVIEGFRDGREIGTPKDKGMFPPPPPGGSGTGSGKSVMFDGSFKFKSLAFTALLFPVSLFGCSLLHSAQPVLSDVAIAANDASEVLSIIEEAAKIFFSAQPNAAAEAIVEKSISDCRYAALAAMRTAQAAESLDQGQVDAAFNSFKESYANLLGLLTNLGIVSNGKLAARRGSVVLPQPMVLHLKVHS